MIECIVCRTEMEFKTDTGLCLSCTADGYIHDHGKCPKAEPSANGRLIPPPNHKITQRIGGGPTIAAVTSSIILLLLVSIMF